MESRKMVLRNLPTGQQRKQNRLLDTAVEGEGGMIWDSNIEMYRLPYMQ